MSKAVLVMDMPSSCNECICRFVNIAGKTICRAKIEELKPKSDKRPDWCPLKPMIEKKDRNKVVGDYLRGRCDGYNACIDELLADKE